MSTAQILRAIHSLPESAQWHLFTQLGVTPKKTVPRPKEKAARKSAAFSWSDLHEFRQRTFGKRVLTNTPPCGAFRGHGTVDVRFAFESLLDQMAIELGID